LTAAAGALGGAAGFKGAAAATGEAAGLTGAAGALDSAAGLTTLAGALGEAAGLTGTTGALAGAAGLTTAAEALGDAAGLRGATGVLTGPVGLTAAGGVLAVGVCLIRLFFVSFIDFIFAFSYIFSKLAKSHQVNGATKGVIHRRSEHKQIGFHEAIVSSGFFLRWK